MPRAFILSLALLLSSLAAASDTLTGANAEPETRALYTHLKAIAKDHILFGHQETTAYGIGWQGDPGRSDVKSVTGAYPAVYGWDFFELVEAGTPEKLERFRSLVSEAYQRGGINTFSWHMYNPVTGENFYDTTPAVAAILPGGDKHDHYKTSLDAIAAFALSLKGRNGGHIPIIFRPFHEHMGNWFWWGKKHCTPEEYVALWRFTVDYLRDQKGVHNLLYAYSPNIAYGPSSGGAYLSRYPGDAYVDILGLDAYVKDMTAALGPIRQLVELARERGKVPALTEAGYPDGLSKTTQTDWYTTALLAPLAGDPVAREIAYVLVWRNASKDHYWVPYPGGPGEEDFRKFHAHPIILFEDKLPNMYALSN
ncbi:MAG: beta-mannosidase [Candidatus Hydrogenedentes bacterium]|nr:beta-mannosidase [Candidatus Hydrogenedentota bacterium]